MTLGGLRIGTEVLWLVGLAALGAGGVVAAGVPAFQGRRVPAGALLLGLMLVALSAPLLSWIALVAAPADLAGQRLGLDTAGVLRLLGVLATLGVSGLQLLFLGAVALQVRPRGAAGPALAVLTAVAAAACSLYGASLFEDWVFGGLRAGLDLGVGLLVAPALIGARDGERGADVAAAALGVGAMAYASVEAVFHGLAIMLILPQLEVLAPELRDRGAVEMLATLAPVARWQLVGLGVWTIAGLGGIGAACASARSARPATAVLALGAAWVITLVGVPGIDALRAWISG